VTTEQAAQYFPHVNLPFLLSSLVSSRLLQAAEPGALPSTGGTGRDSTHHSHTHPLIHSTLLGAMDMNFKQKSHRKFKRVEKLMLSGLLAGYAQRVKVSFDFLDIDNNGWFALKVRELSLLL
jgi:hypothetical protein